MPIRLSSLLLFCVAFLSFSPPAVAQVSQEQREYNRALNAIREVPGKISSEEYGEALSILEDTLPVIRGMFSVDPSARIVYGYGLYAKGVCHIMQEDYGEAAGTFEDFVRGFPNHANAMKARLMLGESFLYQEDYEGILQAVPAVIRTRGVPYGEVQMGHQLMAEAYFQLEMWEPAIPHFQWLFQRGPDATVRFSAAAQLSTCLIRLERYSDLYAVVPQLYTTDAKYNVGLHMTLLEEGDRLYELELPDKALLMYRLIIPFSELSLRIEERIMVTQQMISDLKRVQTGFSDGNRRVRMLEFQLEGYEGAKDELEAVPDYDLELRIRLGDVYYQLERWEEAIQLYLSIHEINPDHELAERAMYSAYMAAFQGQEYYRAWEIAQQYMDAYPEGGEYWDDFTLHAAGLLVSLERWFECDELVDRALKVSPEHVSTDNMLYMKGYSQFQMSQIRESMETFSKLMTEHSRSPFLINAEYWHALGHLFLQEYPEARDGFRVIVDRNRGGPLREDGFYRMGVAEYGMGDFDAAKQTLDAFLAEFPGSILASEAQAMIGDIQASWGELDQALESYRQAVDSAVNMVQADYATFQQARTFEIEQRWQEIIDLFDAYKERYSKEEANYTEATYWKGNALKQLGKQEEALNIFYDAIIAHGDQLDAYGIDFILRDLLEELNNTQGDRDLAFKMKDRLYKELKTAQDEDKQTLLLRLEGLQYETSENEALRTAIEDRMMKEDNIAFASPITLELMGRIAEEKKNSEFARKVYEHFLEEFEDSDLILNALVGLSENRIQEERYVEAEELLRAITDRFPSMYEAAEAWIRLGDLYRMKGEFKEAEETYTLILSVKDWRGELWPRALLKLGDTHAENKAHDKANGFYQRVYVMYVGYPPQAAEAYVRSAEMLKAMGKNADAKKALQEMLDQAPLAAQPIAQEARAMIMNL